MNQDELAGVIAQWVIRMPLWAWGLIFVALFIALILVPMKVERRLTGKNPTDEKAAAGAAAEGASQPSASKAAAAGMFGWLIIVWNGIPKSTQDLLAKTFRTALELSISGKGVAVLAAVGVLGSTTIQPREAETRALTQVATRELPRGCLLAGVGLSAADLAVAIETPRDDAASAQSGRIAARPDGRLPAATLYFDPASVTLGAGAAARLTDIKNRLSKEPALSAIVTGFADRVGSAESNQLTGYCRAIAATQALAAAGIPLDRIWIFTAGESQNAVVTADEVSEPLNRRVEIVLR
jgi:outer membrane protein OmpA-like peptidoglycan-associated protein